METATAIALTWLLLSTLAAISSAAPDSGPIRIGYLDASRKEQSATGPLHALMAELGHTPQDRMLISTLTSIAWSLGFIIGNGTFSHQWVIEHPDHLVTGFGPEFFHELLRRAEEVRDMIGIISPVRDVFAGEDFKRDVSILTNTIKPHRLFTLQ